MLRSASLLLVGAETKNAALPEKRFMNSNLLAKMLATLLSAAISASAQTNFILFQSAPERTALLELFTSEGCSSCPPAETWLSGLTTAPRLWKEFAPVAFHVDYWNHLGWKDAWSDAEFSERQRGYAQVWQAASIYTPELVLNGKEWHNWFTGRSGPQSDGKKVGVLTVTSGDMKLWQISFDPATNSGAPYDFHAAQLAGGIVSNVKAGENQGNQLKHDFVALHLIEISTPPSNGVARGHFIINALRPNAGTTRALVAWVTQANKLQPIQAVGGWLIGPDKN